MNAAYKYSAYRCQYNIIRIVRAGNLYSMLFSVSQYNLKSGPRKELILLAQDKGINVICWKKDEYKKIRDTEHYLF